MILFVLLKNKENLQLSTLQFYSSNSLWMRRMEMKYHKTNEMVYKICKEYKEPVRSEIYRDFLMADFNHKLASCLHAKVGSTTWSNHFNAISPNDTKNELEHKFGKRLFKYDVIGRTENFEEDVKYIMKKSNLESIFSMKGIKKLRRKKGKSDNSNDTNSKTTQNTRLKTTQR